MATNKTLNTRIQLKYDLYNNWVSANPVLLKGEIAVVEIPAASNAVANEPAILFKVGDGSKNFNSLNWASGSAADVYSWAKESTLSINKDGSGNVVAGITWDASLNGGKGGIKYTTASVATSEGLEALQATVDTINKDYLKGADKDALQNAIDAKMSTADFEAFEILNDAAIEDAKKAGTDAAAALETYKTSNDTAVAGVKTTADKAAEDIAKLNGADTLEGSVAHSVKAAIDAEVIRANGAYDAKGAAAQALVDAKAYADGLDTAMDARVDALEAKFGDGEGNVESQIAAAIEAEVEARNEAIKVEADRAAAAEKVLTDDLATEIARAKAAEKANTDAIAVEKGRLDAFLEAAEVGDAAVDTLKEIQNYIDTHGEAAATMTTNIAANTKAIEDEVARATGVEAGLETRLAAVEAYDHAGDLQKAKDYADGLAKNYDAAGSANAVDDKLTAEVTRAKEAEAQALTDAKAYADSLASDYATAAQGALADTALQSVSVLGHTLSKNSNTITVEQAKTALGLKSAAYAEASAFDAAGAAGAVATTAASNLATVKSGLEAEIAKKVIAVTGKSLVSDTEITKLATVEENAEKNIIETVKVAGVALTPDADRAVNVVYNIDDLAQTADTYVVFNCGSATTNI